MKTKNDRIAMEIYRQMYKECEPKEDLAKLMKSGKTQVPGWFDKYYLPQERQIAIINKTLDKYKIKHEYIRGKWHAEILLGAAPNSQKKDEK